MPSAYKSIMPRRGKSILFWPPLVGR